MKYIVYKTTCLINNKIYIGVHQTENPEIFDGYLGRGYFIGKSHYLKFPESPLHYAIIKYGDANFNREILHTFETEEEAYIMESQIVDEKFINSEKTYNVSIGGKGRPRPMQPVFQFDFSGNLIKFYNSALEASKIIDRSVSNIYAAINYKRTCKNSLWGRESVIDINEYQMNTNSKYYLYNQDGLFIDEFESSKEITAFLDTNSANLSRAIKASYKISGYFISNEKFDKLQITVSKTSEKLNRYSLDGVYIDSFQTVREARERLNLKLGNISTAIKLKKQCNGFLWTRNDNPIPNIN